MTGHRSPPGAYGPGKATTLPMEILNCVMTFIEDQNDLFAAMQACRVFYDAGVKPLAGMWAMSRAKTVWHMEGTWKTHGRHMESTWQGRPRQAEARDNSRGGQSSQGHSRQLRMTQDESRSHPKSPRV